MRGWVSEDLDAALSAWDHLLSVIETTLPASSVLLLPVASGPVHWDSEANPHFEQDWGAAKMTVSRYAGLYSSMVFSGAGADTVWFLTRDGTDKTFVDAAERPWGRKISLTLAKILTSPEGPEPDSCP